MSDMLVKLYEVQEDQALIERLAREGVQIKRAMPMDIERVLTFVRANFSEGWAQECAFALYHRTCYIGVKNKQVIGFACYEATRPDYFGPTGVQTDMRGIGLGRALLLKCMAALRDMGYAYAIIGWAGPKDFYRKAVGAIEIEGSVPHSYGDGVTI